MLFHSINEVLWGDVSISMLTLFRVATFEDWTDYLGLSFIVILLTAVHLTKKLVLMEFTNMNKKEFCGMRALLF
jgi:voltage-gated sodium channel